MLIPFARDAAILQTPNCSGCSRRSQITRATDQKAKVAANIDSFGSCDWNDTGSRRFA
jgi:hypothetical protein